MPDDANSWLNAGPLEHFSGRALTEVTLGKTKLAISHRDGVFGAISNICNHAGGPLGQGRLDGEYVVCPWHNWKFHRLNGRGEPGFEDDAVPSHEVKVENGYLLVRATPVTARCKKPHAPHPLARAVKREPGAIRVVGISTTAQDPANPRYSTSEALLEVALKHVREQLKCETQLIKLSELKFRACEGYYSKSAHACTWPCSITQMDEADQLTPVYEAIVHWAERRSVTGFSRSRPPKPVTDRRSTLSRFRAECEISKLTVPRSAQSSALDSRAVRSHKACAAFLPS